MPYVAMAMATISLGLSALLWSQQSNEQDRLVASQRSSCHKVGEPIQDALIQVLKDQIQGSKRVPRSYFPNIPKAEFEKLLRESQRQRTRILVKLQKVPSCEQRFGH